MKKILIALVEDHVMFRKALVSHLESSGNSTVLFDVPSGRELFAALDNELPDIILMDCNLPGKGGIQLTKEVKEKHPDIKVIMLSCFDQEVYIKEAIANGASAYLSKLEDPEEIFTAIQSVITHGYYLSQRVAQTLINRVQLREKEAKSPSLKEQLLPVELKIIQLMSEELTSKEIADKLSKSVRTIDFYKNSIMKKTGASNACGVIMYAVRNGIIHITT